MDKFFRIAIAAVGTVAVVVGVGAAGCATTSDAAPERLADGSYRLKCGTSLSRCLDRVDEVCHGNRFTVLGAVDQRDYRGGLGMEEGETRSSRAVIRCGARARTLFSGNEDPLPTLATQDKASDKSASPGPAPTAATRACVPGATQACIGQAACAGGQACLPDGSGFAACDCGGTPAANVAPPTTAPAAPGGTPAP